MQVADMKQNLKTLEILYLDIDKQTQEEFLTLFASLECSVTYDDTFNRYTQKIKEKYYDIIVINVASLKEGYLDAEQIFLLHPQQEMVFIGDSDDTQALRNACKMHISAYLFLPLKSEDVYKAISELASKISVKQQLQEDNQELLALVEKKQKELFYKSFHDSLTGLCNSFALDELLKKETKLNFILLNVDNFGDINNAYGFKAGDHVLKEISKFLTILKPQNAKLFRLNSDEFVYIIEELVREDALKEFLNSIEYFFNEAEVTLDGDIETRISFSIGVTYGQGVELIDQAKIAILELREHNNRGTSHFFHNDSTFLKRQKENVYWIHKIKDAISTGNLFPYYQPIVNNKTCKVEKYECLARIDELDTLIAPIRFMEAAKITGMLPHITRTIIQQSFETFADNSYEFSINITSEDLYMEYLEGFLLRNAKKYGIDPSRVVLEILEDIASLKEATTIKQLSSLRQHGFKIAIDDFGSQSSNFSRLLEFSPDYLKIDGAFIKDLIEDEKSRIICEAIVFISHKSNIKVIAEYVHSQEVQETVQAMGIDYSQGYFLGKPEHKLL